MPRPGAKRITSDPESIPRRGRRAGTRRERRRVEANRMGKLGGGDIDGVS